MTSFVLLEPSPNGFHVIATFSNRELAEIYVRLHRASSRVKIVEVKHYTDDEGE